MSNPLSGLFHDDKPTSNEAEPKFSPLATGLVITASTAAVLTIYYVPNHVMSFIGDLLTPSTEYDT